VEMSPAPVRPHKAKETAGGVLRWLRAECIEKVGPGESVCFRARQLTEHPAAVTRLI
jgi:hypothetical protein